MSSSPKGYATQKKNDQIVPAQFATVQPLDQDKFGLDVHASMYVRTVASDIVEAGSTATQINATAHSALVGDIIRITSGALIEQRVRVLKIDTNIIYVTDLSAAPSAADTFNIQRHANPRVNDSGDIQVNVTSTATPLLFKLDSVDTEVSEDTGTPANSVPLPVKVLDAAGLVPDFSTETTLAALNAKVTAVDTGAVVVSSSALPTGAATEATLSALNGKVTAVDTGAVTIASSALPTGAATEATLSALNGKVTAVDTGDVTISAALPAGTNNIGDVDVLSLPKSGTATSSNIAASATSVTILASNPTRLGVSIYNDSSEILYIKFGPTASTTSYGVQLPANAYYELPFAYTGLIDGIWTSASGTARVVEFT